MWVGSERGEETALETCFEVDDLVNKLLKDGGTLAYVSESLHACEEESVSEWLRLYRVNVIEMNKVGTAEELLTLDILCESLVDPPVQRKLQSRQRNIGCRCVENTSD